MMKLKALILLVYSYNYILLILSKELKGRFLTNSFITFKLTIIINIISLIHTQFLLIDCPLLKFIEVHPSPSFTTVAGYNATLTCSYDGYYTKSSPFQVWLMLPKNHIPQYIDEFPYYDCKCWVEHRFTCPVGTDPNYCCRFELLMHSTPQLDDNGTVFSCNRSFANEYTSQLRK